MQEKQHVSSAPKRIAERPGSVRVAALARRRRSAARAIRSIAIWWYKSVQFIKRDTKCHALAHDPPLEIETGHMVSPQWDQNAPTTSKASTVLITNATRRHDADGESPPRLAILLDEDLLGASRGLLLCVVCGLRRDTHKLSFGQDKKAVHTRAGRHGRNTAEPAVRCFSCSRYDRP